MTLLSDERLLEVWNSNQCTSDELAMLRAVADAAVAADREQQAQFKAAYEEWSNKTEWLQHEINKGTIELPKSPLGKHRADVLFELVQHLRTNQISATSSHSENCLGRERCLALANAVLNDMDCHSAFEKNMAQQKPAAPIEWRELMIELACELEAEIKNKYPADSINYPSVKCRYDCDMDLVNRARTLLAKSEQQL